MENNVCKVCGTAFDSDNRFCANCGTARDAELKIEQTPAVTVAQPTEAQPVQTVQPVSYIPVQQPTNDGKTRFKGLYIPAKILSIVGFAGSLFMSLYSVLVAFVITMARLTGANLDSAELFAMNISVPIFISILIAEISLVPSIIAIVLGNKIKAQDPTDPGVKVLGLAKAGLIISIVCMVACFFI